MTEIPARWSAVLKFAVKNKGEVKNSSFNHIPDTPCDTRERKYTLDCMVQYGLFEISKPGQVYIYTLTEKGRIMAYETIIESCKGATK